MAREFRRVVTGVDEHGVSVVRENAPLPTVEVTMMPGWRFYEVWGADGLPVCRQIDPAPVSKPYFPSIGGNRFGILRFPPHTSATAEAAELPSPEELETLVGEAESKLPGLIGVFEPDSPGMHTTESVDYDYVIGGELHLELDNGEEVRLPAGTCVINNGNRHAWHNHGDVEAVLLYVLLGADTPR
jgi:quercetin dioxygenase-like cupin family protein